MSIADCRRLAGLAIILALAGCAAPSPAPVVSRTTPPPPVARPAPAPGPATRPTPPVASAPAPSTEIEAAPIPPSGVEVRPLEPAAPIGPPPLTAPQGVKRPYSETALAALRSGSATPPPAAPKPPPAPPAESPPDAVSQAGFSWPANGKVVQPFSSPRNMGIVIAGVPGAAVHAAADGRVIFSGAGPRGYGNLVIVKHDDDTLSVYAQNRSLIAKEGQNVRRGQKIAEMGDSGDGASQLHFEIRKAGRPVDPQKLLPSR